MSPREERQAQADGGGVEGVDGLRQLHGEGVARIQPSGLQDQDLRDAGLIASAQRVEHYEIAVYGSLATWAEQLGLEEDLQALLGILEEEKRTDERLSTLAKRVVNPDAAAT